MTRLRAQGRKGMKRTTVSSSPFASAPLSLRDLGPGRPLDANTRARLEPHLGQDLKEVRIHTGAQSEEAVNAVDARAFTVGRDVVFGEGQYQPGTREGLALLAHEVTHVAQQAATGSLSIQRAPKEPAQFESPTTKKAGVADLIKAFLELPEVKKAIDDFTKRFREAPTADKVGAVAGMAAVGAGAVAGIASNPEARKEVLGMLHGQEAPVPGVPGLSIQIFTQDTLPKFDPLKGAPKPEISTPTGAGAMLKFQVRF